MSSIEKYKLTNGQIRYRVRYRTPERRTTDKRGFTSRRDAQAFLVQVEGAKARGEYVAPSAGRATVAELGTAWLSRQVNLKPSALRVVEIAWRVHVLPRWGEFRVADLRRTSVQGWVAEQVAAGSSATVIARNLGVLSGLLSDAVSDRLIATNPAQGVKVPRKKPARRQYLTHEQVHALADAAAQPHHRVMVYLLSYTGLRFGEAAALRVQDLDLLRRRIHVRRAAVEVGREVVVGSPKTHRARVVPIPRFLVTELARLCEGLDRDALIFPGSRGEFMRPPRTGSWFARAVQRSGAPRVTAHDLRHTAASLAVSAGANVKVIQRMLGHASAAVTLDIYADLLSGDLDAVADAMDDAATAATTPKRAVTA